MAENKDGKDAFSNMFEVTQFSGEDHTYASTKWAQDLDDNAEIFEWTAKQRLIIARRSLTGTAGLWLKTEKVHKTYEELKAAVLKEFPDAASTKEMHEMMAARKKCKDESYYQYMLIMKEMGKRAKFPDYVAIQYVIDGIQDMENNKAILYGANTYPALKEKLSLYENIKKKVARQNVERPAKQASAPGTGQSCYNCGEKNHKASACRNGIKCFKCNQFGHISSKCTNLSAAGSGGSSVGTVTSVKQPRVAGSTNQQTPQVRPLVKQFDAGTKKHSATCSTLFGRTTAPEDGSGGHEQCCKMADDVDVMQIVNKPSDRLNKAMKSIKICDKIISALVDTGSDVNLIRADLWNELNVSCSNDNTMLSGLGLSKVRSCGKIILCLQIDNKSYADVMFHIVSKGSMPYKLIIGQEFLQNVVMVVREGAVLFLSQDDEWLTRVNCCVRDVDVTGHISNPSIKMEVERLIKEYKPVQTREAPIEMKIVLKDDVPIAQRPRRISHME